MRNHPDAVMLFAAGFGTRMGALTADRPKPMVEVAGRPLIDHALDLVRDVAPGRTVVNLHYKAEVLAIHLEGRDIALSLEQPDILETGGGLRAALPLLGHGPVYTMNTDAIWHGENPLNALAKAWDPDRMDALLACVRPENAVGHTGKGDFLMLQDGRLLRGPGLIYGGVQIIKTDGLTAIEDKAFSLNLLWNRMLGDRRLFGLPYAGKWCDVGSPEGIGQAEDMIGWHHV